MAPKTKKITGRSSKAQTSAVYRGAGVTTFKQDLSNYSQLRRGLSPAMRAQTMTKTELKTVDAGTAQSYINALNEWRTSSQLTKTQRGGKGRDPVEAVLTEAAATDYYTATEKAELLTANLKLKTMTKEQARTELMEDLNVVDRTRNQDFYKAQYYLDEGTFDPELATDDMLRAIISSGYIYKYPEQAQPTIDEYIRRLRGLMDSATAEGQVASESAAFRQDILNVARLINY